MGKNKSSPAENGWNVVVSKMRSVTLRGQLEKDLSTLEEISERVELCRKEMEKEGMDIKWKEWLLSSPLLELRMENHLQLVCYGIGRIGRMRNCQFQLIALLLLKDVLGVPEFLFYDPVLSASEVKYLNSIGGRQITVNEEGKREAKVKTVFFMPHCGRALYNNVLWRNWSCEGFSRLFIIGNSFKRYVDQVNPTKRGSSDGQRESGECIRRAQEYFDEILFENDFKAIGALNDFSLHWCSRRNIDQKLWESVPEEYIADGECDTIIPAFVEED